MKAIVKKYRAFLFIAILISVYSFFNVELGKKVFSTSLFQLKEMFLVIPPIFILMGLLDVWVPKETMVKYMGEKSGLKGILLSLFIGSAAAGPLYGAFPVAAVFMKKGVKFTNVLIFLGAWSTTKIPMFLFEMTALGARFAVTRLLIDIPGIIAIAYLLTVLIPKKEVSRIYEATMEKN
ncbi:permease [uncultured Sphaerochaeta sp.]|uniref:permease n=1 Tax=uncultured Sphaerochaeta sp. TaxID=886478 RepID=UPI002A0A931D|nr:permease [uncultured Sphaerochaeta sp.]